MVADGGASLLLLLFGLAWAFWMWMVIDCVKCEDGGTRIAWLLVILLAGVIGTPLYFFFRKLPRHLARPPIPSVPLLQPWQKNQRMG